MRKESASPQELEAWNDVLFAVYQGMPAGVILLDAGGTVLSANQAMRSIFPPCAELPSLGGLLGCPFARSGSGPCGKLRECKACALWNGLRRIVRRGRPMLEIKLQHTGFVKGHRRVRWFEVSGIPVMYWEEPYAVLFFSDVTKREQRERMLLAKLDLDQPTGVLNKVSLLRAVDSLLREENRHPFTLCMVDFDGLKAVNDRCGHPAGDKVLNAFCSIARRNVRAGDILGRYGGNEFLFVFRTGEEQSVKILERIRGSLRDTFAGVFPAPVTFSAGVVCCDGKNGPWDWRDLIRAADALLYRARAGGGGRTVTRPAPSHPGNA